MKIDVTVTQEELNEMSVTTEELKDAIMEDLDYSRDYSGFNVNIILTDDLSSCQQQ